MTFSLRTFFKNKSNFFLIISSSILFFLVFIFDLAFLPQNNFPKNIYWTREGMITVASLLFGLVIYRRHFEEEKNITYKLKTFFFSILGLYLAAVVPSMIFGAGNFSFAKSYIQFLSLLQNNLKNLLLSVFVTVFLIINLFWIRDFVFYKSKRGTHRLFFIAMLFLALSVIYGHYSHKIKETEWLFHGQSPSELILFGSLLFLFTMLSLRTAWVNYLNKRQKILTFWGGVLLLPGAFMFWQTNTLQSISHYSFTLGIFDKGAALFLSIYLVSSIVSLLLHLPTASIFDKRMKEIASLQNLSRVISSVLHYDEVVSRVTSLTQDVLKSDSCWLEMVQENGELKIVSSENLSWQEKKNTPLDRDRGISGWIFKNRASVLVNDVSKDSRTKYLRKHRKNIASILGVPLISQKRVIGILFAVKNEVYGFDQDDREMSNAFANQATVAIENARLLEESLEKERLEQELRVAHDTQMKLLPKEMPKVKGLQIEALCVTAYEVGGDYYDFIRLDEDKLGLVIADVSGKGLSAAFYMAELKGIVNSFARLYYSPKLFLQKVNETLYENVDRKTFVSMIYAIMDFKKGKMTFCRAGHCPVIYYNAKGDTTSILRPDGIGVALDAGNIFNATLEECEIKWHNNDFFFFYTDGLTEARNAKKEEYGEDRVVEIIEAHRHESMEMITRNLTADVIQFIGKSNKHDDLSLVGTKIQEEINE